jgi:hypothetical protein
MICVAAPGDRLRGHDEGRLGRPSFRLGLGWGVLFGVQMLILPEPAPAFGARWLWPVINLAICLAPALIWSLRRRSATASAAVRQPAMSAVWSRR